MFRQLDEKMLVSGQLGADDLAEAKRLGVTMIVNNRPDDEEPGQPRSAELEQAAKAEGLDYRHHPIVRGMGPAHIEHMREALDAASGGKILAFCRTGTRSTLAWACARREEGVPREELERAAEGAGYSLQPVAHLL